MTLRFGYQVLGLAFMLVLAFLTACQPNDDTWQRIQASGILRVGMDPTFPPFELAEGDSLSGLDVDLAEAIADDLGLEPEFSFIGYDGLYDALATGRVDVLISALVVIPERTKDFAYSESYFNAGEILVVNPASKDIEVMEQLSGRTLAVELGAQGHVEATIWERRLKDLTIQPYNSAGEALAAVAAGSADAALVDAVSGRLYLQDNPALSRSSQPVTVQPYAMVVRIEDKRLLEKLNESIFSFQASGRLDDLISRWMAQ